MKMKVIGNRNGSFLVGDDVDETSDEYSCTLDHENVEVDGDPNGECVVTIEAPDGLMNGRFLFGELIGKWQYAD